jgi:8-oxo-dGTP pyrophosphatase MutT (NUDIX family)
VRRPDRSTGVYWVVDSADIALVVPVDVKRIHLVEHYRHPVGGRQWEFPSGTVDKGDLNPASAAEREPCEETGYGPGS